MEEGDTHFLSNVSVHIKRLTCTIKIIIFSNPFMCTTAISVITDMQIIFHTKLVCMFITYFYT